MTTDPSSSPPVILLEFSMAPLGVGESVGSYVADAVRIIAESGLDYRLHAMGTIIEGEWDSVFGVLKSCFERMRRECPRITCTLKFDYRAGATGRLTSKVSSVTSRAGVPVKTVEPPDGQ